MLASGTNINLVFAEVYKPALYKELNGEFVIQQLDEMPEVKLVIILSVHPASYL